MATKTTAKTAAKKPAAKTAKPQTTAAKPKQPQFGLSLTGLKEIAKRLSVRGYSRMTKDQIIPAIQTAEGNAPCYRTIHNCGLSHCLFFQDCQQHP